MNRPIKLLVLIILSLSVYFIYQHTKQSNIKILSLGDNFTIQKNNHIELYKQSLKNKKVKVINYSKEDLTIHELNNLLKTNNSLKRDLMESHLLFITIGYNDLIYKISLEDNMNTDKLNSIINEISIEYKELLLEINKYYKNKIIIVGYPRSTKDDYYLNLGIRKLNRILNTNNYINTYNLSNNNENIYVKICEEIKKLELVD
ncbi:MAG: hypothetical protein IK137_03330 [Bacilli bacterium]|nr:hypothetical protein [Bacilli bacterium]